MKFRAVVLNLALLFIIGLLWLFGFFYLLQVFTSEYLEHPLVLILLGVTIFGTILSGTQIVYFLHQMMKLINAHRAFSQISIELVKKIRRNIGIISACFLFALPFFVTAANADDAPGVVLLGLAIVCAPASVYVLSQIIEDLFISAFDLQQDHDLTV